MLCDNNHKYYLQTKDQESSEESNNNIERI